MKRTRQHPINPWIQNGVVADFYLANLRRRNRLISRLLSIVLGTEITCRVPDNFFLPHPYGIIVGAQSVLSENVTLMHQVTLGGKDPWCQSKTLENSFPTLCEGVYVGAGAKILGNVIVGEWSIIGANAVITKNVPAGSTVVGDNRIVKRASQPRRQS